MKTLFSIVLTLLLLNGQPVLAHSDHAHGPISEAKAKQLAANVVAHLSKQDAGLDIGKLPASWSAVVLDGIAMHKTGKGFFILSVINASLNQTLYVLMSDTGEVYDVNDTGVFEGLK